MLIRLLEVDVYDEEEEEEEGEDQWDLLTILFWPDVSLVHVDLNLLVFFSSPETSEVATPVNTWWPDIEEIRKLPFDLYPRDPKFRKASPVYTDKMPKCSKGQQEHANNLH